MKNIIPGLLLFIFSLTGLRVTAQHSDVSLDHIAIFVQNLDSSASFYSKLFGFGTIPNPFKGARVVWFKIANGIQFHMVEGLKSPVNLPFMSHFCFSVHSLDEMIATLSKNGISYYSGGDMKPGINHRPDGVDQIFIKDPDNYWVEINNAGH